MNKQQMKKTATVKVEITTFPNDHVMHFNADKVICSERVGHSSRPKRTRYDSVRKTSTRTVLDRFYGIDGIANVELSATEVVIWRDQASTWGVIIPGMIDQIEQLLGCKAEISFKRAR